MVKNIVTGGQVVWGLELLGLMEGVPLYPWQGAWNQVNFKVLFKSMVLWKLILLMENGEFFNVYNTEITEDFHHSAVPVTQGFLYAVSYKVKCLC